MGANLEKRYRQFPFSFFFTGNLSICCSFGHLVFISSVIIVILNCNEDVVKKNYDVDNEDLMTGVFICRQSEDAPKTKLGFDNVNVVIPGRCLLMMVMVILMGIGD